MALITVSGEPGCRTEEVARMAAQRLGWELITESRLSRMIREEFGAVPDLPEKANAQLALSIFAKLAHAHHLITTAAAADVITPKQFPGLLRLWLTAPDAWRVGTLMVDRRLERSDARRMLADLDREYKISRKLRSGRATRSTRDSDLVANISTLDAEVIAELIENTVRLLNLDTPDYLSPAAEARLQFQARLELSKHGISPPAIITLNRVSFSHPSEHIFANLLDFYRIAWEYEPRSFPIQWDTHGRVLEAFTPDFYLPEFDLYIELTTMKQAHVTKKNRKVKLLRTIYPQVNIQVFYQKDFQNLIFKYGLAERPVTA